MRLGETSLVGNLLQQAASVLPGGVDGLPDQPENLVVSASSAGDWLRDAADGLSRLIGLGGSQVPQLDPQGRVPVTIHPVAPGSKGVRDFIDVAFQIYAGDPNWVRPLDLDMRMRLDPKQNPFFQHADCQLFVARRGDQLVGRVSAQIDHEHQRRYGDQAGFFGFLDTVNDQEVADALLKEAAGWLRERGMTTMRGPLSLNINEETGLLVEGFETPPMILMPHHRSYQGDLVEAAGFKKLKDLYAWTYQVGDVPPRAQRAHDAVAQLPEVKLRPVNLRRMNDEVHTIVDIFNDAWEKNWGFVPATEAEVRKMGEDFKLILIPELALIVEINGKPAAVAIALPNINEAIRDLNGQLFPTGFAKLLWRLKVQGPKTARLVILGIKKEFRNMKQYGGLSHYLYVEMNERGKALGMTHGELSWTLEDNGPVNVGIRSMGGKVYKRYRVYERAL